jgi:hypothetical protein
MTYEASQMGAATLWAKLMGALSDKRVPRSITELADYTGLHMRTVQRYVRALRDHRPRLVRIAEWDEDAQGNRSIPLYTMGRGEDMPRPKLTQAEKDRRYKANKRAKVATVFDLGARHEKQLAATRPTGDARHGEADGAVAHP